MNIEQTTELYAAVLRQLFPTGGYDTSPETVTAKDVYAHAKLFAQADMDAKRILSVLETIPPELIVEYENAHGLPLKCSTNVSRTFEERLEILNWVRNTKNVLNRAYLTQLLKIFGVVLVDVIKFKPIQCTASCTSAVNTEQLRYKVLLRLEYPAAADIECIIENYLPSYLRVDYVIDMQWGDWIVDQNILINSAGMAKYSAYKTNNVDYYDTTAEISLLNAVIRSLSDVDMEQWQAVKDACSQLAGVNEWVFDATNNRIIYKNTVDPDPISPSNAFYYILSGTGSNPPKFSTPALACRWSFEQGRADAVKSTYPEYSHVDGIYCYVTNSNRSLFLLFDSALKITNPAYDPTAVLPSSYISFEQIAQKIISNTAAAEPISLHAENYLLNVARSVNSTAEQKQFVKIHELISQFEQNKTLRQ